MLASASNEAFRFYSRYEHGVDEKRRVQIPAKWRPAEADVEWMLILWEHNSPDAGSCVRVYTPRQMEATLKKLDGLSTSDEGAVALRRTIAENCEPVVMDKSGRICVPDTMMARAGLEKLVVLAGAVDWFEIWNPDRNAIQRNHDATRARDAAKNHL